MTHLNKETQQIALLGDKERISSIQSEKWIGYSAAKETLQTMEELLVHPKTYRMPNLLIVSGTGNGKTILTHKFFESHQPVITDSAVSIPVLYVQAPPKPDERAFYINILDALNAVYNIRERPLRLYQQAASILRRVQNKILIIDEIHHILAGPHLQQRVFLNMIKYLGNDLQIVIIGCGIRDALSAINTDKQLANRFEPAILPRWKMDENYLRLLTSFEAMLPLREPSRLIEDEIALKILSMSGGTIGEISVILKKAAIQAINTQKERINLALLNKLRYVAPDNRQKQYESLLV